MVEPPALIAATPVGATTEICLNVFSLIYFNKVVFPVPAFPVKKINWLVRLIKFKTCSNCGLISMVDMRGQSKTKNYKRRSKKIKLCLT